MRAETASLSLIDEFAARGELVAYFGYGSLVNRATHRTKIVGAIPGRARGWQRLWQPRPDMTLNPDNKVEASLLTVRRQPGATIDGLLVFDHVDNLPAVDLRENDYHRRLITPENISVAADADPVPEGCPVYIYEADPSPEPDAVYPILQSYLDAVLQGFFREHGARGVAEFVVGTGNFETPILVDRDWPIYPRAVTLEDGERELIDRLLDERGVEYLPR